ncbi:luciferase family protein [Paenibacillus sp. NPDC056579]|uniref:luciferase domain-containing protein n=1 Tax=Paenibacillus sp. NPDC056579 TaxID=3345871 RepID=UPI0036C6D10B
MFDLLIPKTERDRWIEEGNARSYRMYPDLGWVSVYYLNIEQEVAHAIEIARSK